MRRIRLLFICLVTAANLFAQEKLFIHNSTGISEGVFLSSIDSLYFNQEGSVGYFVFNQTRFTYLTALIDSMTFGPDALEITVVFSDNKVSVINPLAFEGVQVKASGAHVTVYSTTETRDITYNLSGSTANGSFKMYSNKRFILTLNNVDLTNPNGPAINIQSDTKAFVQMVEGSANTLTDGNTYNSAPLNSEGDEEDQKAVFFSEGKLEFEGLGTLTINGITADKHALCSDDEIDFNNGTIIIACAAKDGIHAKNGFRSTGGNLIITSAGDGIDGDEGYISISDGSITINTSVIEGGAMVCDSFCLISGGTINLATSGNASKGIKTKQGMYLLGGQIIINSTGDALLEASGSGYEVTYSTAIACDSTITIDGAQITIDATGAAGRGISSDMDIRVSGGILDITCTGNGATYTNSTANKDAYASVCLKADADIIIDNGTLTLINAGSAGKGISADGNLLVGADGNTPQLSITTSGAKITISSSGQGPNTTVVASEAKAISVEGAITIKQGNITISSADDGLKSTTSVTIDNANVNIIKATEGIESPAITVNSGMVSIVASDDGFNATKGNGGESNDNSALNLNGGNIYVNCSGGDGLDSNGNITISGGTAVVHGPQSSPEVGMDYNGTCNVTGGLLIISGTNSNMTQAMSNSSTQYGIKATTNSSIAAGTIFHIQDANGNSLVTFKPNRSYYSIVFSSSDLQNGSTYYIYTGGSSSGTNNNGLFIGGTYSGGTQKKSFTITSKVTSVSF